MLAEAAWICTSQFDHQMVAFFRAHNAVVVDEDGIGWILSCTHSDGSKEMAQFHG